MIRTFKKLVAAALSRRQYLTLRNTVRILRGSGIHLNAEQEEQCKKFEAVVAAYEEPMANTPEQPHIDPTSHCLGCYDPETCPGVDLRTRHCADCVVGGEEETVG